MRRILTSVVLLVLLFPSLALGGGLKWGHLVKRNELLYKKFTNVPFTGTVIGQYQGKVRNGKLDGPWFEYYKNGQLQEKGAYKNGKRDGPWFEFSRDGRVSWKVSYSDGVRDGLRVKVQYLEGRVWRETTYQNGREGASVEYIYKTEGTLDRYWTGTYKDGVRDGLWVCYRKAGRILVKNKYKYGRLDGPSLQYYKDGQLHYKATYKDGKPDGPAFHYYENKQLTSKGAFKEGKRVGPWVLYYKDGQLQEKGIYKSGKKDGPWVTYTQDGTVIESSTGTYKNGKKIVD